MGREGADGRVHDIVVHETPDPRTFGIECSCGRRWMAFWGQPHVEHIIDLHYRDHGVTRVAIL